MYATWNGHTECVETLVQKENLMGVNNKGKRISSLRLVSKKGYNALHLAAISMANPLNISEITILLLQAGINFIARDKDGKTAYELAELNSNTAFLNAYNSIKDSLIEDPSWLEEDDDGERVPREPPISRENRLHARLLDLQKYASRRPLQNLSMLQEFSEECKKNLERREVFKNYKK